MTKHQITIFHKLNPKVLVLEMTLSDGLASVTRKRFGPPEDEQIIKMHFLTTILEDKRSPIFFRGSEYDAAEWIVFPYDLATLLNNLPKGWGYKATPTLPKFPKPKRSVALFYSEESGLIVD
jgi:hypothetical protein